MEDNFEKTLVLIKPDGIKRMLVGEIIQRLEKRGLQIIASKFIVVSKALAENHYAEHIGKPFYKGLVEYITSAPTMAMVWAGEHAVEAVRQTVGKTNPLEAAPGSIRHDLSLLTSRNLVHASDSINTAKKEIELWFSPNELTDWNNDNYPWVFGKN